MRRLCIALLLLVLLIWGSWWSLHTVERVTGSIIREIEAGELDKAHQHWDSAQLLLGSLLLHDEIDQADRLFDRVLAAHESESSEDFLLDCTELLAQLNHLPELERPSLINLL
ncbi:DUF4363 family protein [Agathobaculum sp. Marseille-P7918]|uniref:DUF4363 family protein n=1 Tax=Agathobaculum sp. Marseille-P7918 TaxID=2479843 RepID=UPI003562FF08